MQKTQKRLCNKIIKLVEFIFEVNPGLTQNVYS